MIILTDKATGATIGTISEEQLEFLRGELVEETDEDQDYWINRDTLDLFREHGADPGLVAMIEQGMAGRRGHRDRLGGRVATALWSGVTLDRAAALCPTPTA